MLIILNILLLCDLLLGIWLLALADGSMDTLISGLLIHAAGQIEVLKDSLRNIKRRAMFSLKMNDNECNCFDRSRCKSVVHLSRPTKEIEDRIYKELLNIIDHHKAILK